RQLTLERADRQQHRTEILLSRRGSIYDSTGMLMAGTVQTKTVFLDPKFMQDSYQSEGHSLVEMDEAIAKLAAAIDKEPFELSQLLGDRADSRFVKVAEHLDEEICQEILKLDIPGVGMIPENERYYPMSSIGAHLLGGMGKDGGIEGLEKKFEKKLAGKNGSKRTLKDSRHRSLAVAAEDYIPPDHGQHLILTLDANIQMIAEQELAAACEKYRAKKGEVIVMNPRTGDVLAMANWPTFDPATLDDVDPRVRLNRCLAEPYEPGSTIKPFIAGPAMAWRLTRPNEIWPIAAKSWRPFGRRIVTDVHAYGPLSTWDVLVKSSNIGMSMIGQRMGNPNLHRALLGFGFGRPTSIDLLGEDPGLVRDLQKWGMNSTISVSQGYELMVTPLQLTRAFCAYANGGRLVQPQVVKGWLDAEGNLVSREQPTELRMLPEAIDPLSAAGVKRILADTLVRGTARGSASTSWNIFGKTGSSHISEGIHGYSAIRYNSSFLGGAPAENPQLVIGMVIHDPDKSYAVSQGMSYYGGAVSAPPASRVLERSLAYLQVPASPELPPPPPEIARTLVNYDAKVYTKDGIARTASARE
ncbi:MAG: penicillin-binding protein 2, partial [Gemmatimonadaceae bacterium]|nr:penicillin-binding protein 2 [Gemmatimonadaceae bacterium]